MPDGSITSPGIDLLRPIITVEENTFSLSLARLVMEEGNELLSRLFKPASQEGIPDNVQAGSFSQVIEGSSQEVTLDFGVHREAVLKTFDYRNINYRFVSGRLSRQNIHGS